MFVGWKRFAPCFLTVGISQVVHHVSMPTGTGHLLCYTSSCSPVFCSAALQLRCPLMRFGCPCCCMACATRANLASYMQVTHHTDRDAAGAAASDVGAVSLHRTFLADMLPDRPVAPRVFHTPPRQVFCKYCGTHTSVLRGNAGGFDVSPGGRAVVDSAPIPVYVPCETSRLEVLPDGGRMRPQSARPDQFF